MDHRQDSICFQSSLKIAADIMINKSNRENVDVDIKKMLELAKTIALIARNPDLDGHQKKVLEGK